MKGAGALASIAIHAVAIGAAASVGARHVASVRNARTPTVFVEIVEAAPEAKESIRRMEPQKPLERPEPLEPQKPLALLKSNESHAPTKSHAPHESPKSPAPQKPHESLKQRESQPLPAPEAAPEERAAVATAPVALNRIVPAYPRSARRKGHEGRTTVEFTLNDDGGVSGARVAAESGHAELDAAALDAVRAARFAPAAGLGAGGPFRLTLDFKLR